MADLAAQSSRWAVTLNFALCRMRGLHKFAQIKNSAKGQQGAVIDSARQITNILKRLS